MKFGGVSVELLENSDKSIGLRQAAVFQFVLGRSTERKKIKKNTLGVNSPVVLQRGYARIHFSPPSFSS